MITSRGQYFCSDFPSQGGGHSFRGSSSGNSSYGGYFGFVGSSSSISAHVTGSGYRAFGHYSMKCPSNKAITTVLRVFPLLE